MANYQLGIKTLETYLSPDGWRVRRYIWPSALQGDPAFPSEAEAVAAVEKSAGRALKPIEAPKPEGIRSLSAALVSAPVPQVRSLPPVTIPPVGTAPVRPAVRVTPAAAMPPTSMTSAAPQRSGKLDAFRHLMGNISDNEVARLAGSTELGVRKHRIRHGIPAALPSAKATQAAPAPAPSAPPDPAPAAPSPTRAVEPAARRSSKLDAYAGLVGALEDAEVAMKAGVTASGVAKYRAARGIPAAPGSRSAPRVDGLSSAPVAPPDRASSVHSAEDTSASTAPEGARPLTGPRFSKIDAHRDIVGVLLDQEVARRAGVTDEAVRQYRVKRGIPAPTRRAVAPMVEALAAATTILEPPAPRPVAALVTVVPEPKKPLSITPPAPEPAAAKGVRPRSSKLDAHRDIVGVLSDREVATRVGMSPDGVRKYRILHGIGAPSAARGRPVPHLKVALKAIAAPVAVTPATSSPQVVPPEAAAAVELRAGPVDVITPVAPPALRTAMEAAVSAASATDLQSAAPAPEPARVPEQKLIAYVVIATRGEERGEFVVLGKRMSEALTRAEAALARGTGGPWEIVEMRASGRGLD